MRKLLALVFLFSLPVTELSANGMLFSNRLDQSEGGWTIAVTAACSPGLCKNAPAVVENEAGSDLLESTSATEPSPPVVLAAAVALLALRRRKR